MIGRIEFQFGRHTLQATLEDSGDWTCIKTTPAPSYLPPGGQLRDGAAVMSGRIIEEVEQPEPDPDVAY